MAEDLPEIGFIAFDAQEPIAVGFLRKMEGPYAMIDSFISNPLVLSMMTRVHAIDLITQELIQKAKQLEIRHLMAFCEYTGTLKRSYRHGFKKLSCAMIGLSLEE